MTAGLTPLSPSEKRALLDLARRAVASRLEGAPAPALDPAPPRLLVRQGVFVTLRDGGELRGCIGIPEPAQPLAEAVARCAAAAAAEDPRFPPLARDELGWVSIEISALEPPVPIRDPGQIVLGRHGLMASRGGRRGVLLPQVPVEQGWDLETFLRETCLKAGLPPDAWRTGATLEAFEAEVFGEEGCGGWPVGRAPRR